MLRLFLHSYERLNKIDQIDSDYIPANFNQIIPSERANARLWKVCLHLDH